MDLIKELKVAKGAGKTDSELVTAQNFQRKAQFYLDFVEAENSTGFHAPQQGSECDERRGIRGYDQQYDVIRDLF